MLCLAASFGSTAADFQAGVMSKAGVEPLDLPYRFLVPPGYSAGERYPLIVFLHGSGERGADNGLPLAKNGNGSLQLVAGQNQADYPAFMLVPQASFLEGWNDNTLRQTLRVIRLLEAEYSIDHDRIYVTGLSLGGEGTYHFAALYPDVFAAAVPMSAWFDGRAWQLAALPIWAFHAADDTSVPTWRGDAAVGAIRQAGGRVIYTRYAMGGHVIWLAAYGNPHLPRWLMAQRRHQPATGTPIVTIETPAARLPPVSSLGGDVVGTAAFPDGNLTVVWSLAVGTAAGLDPALVLPAAGTRAWTASNAVPGTASATFMAFGVGSSWATTSDFPVIGGSTSVNDTRWIVPADPSLAPPAVVVSTPTSSGAVSTLARTIELAGGAAGHPGRPVQAVWWVNDRGGQGVATLSDDGSWVIGDLALRDGENVITVTATDSSHVAGSAVVRIHAGAAPAISAQPQNVFVVAGQPASFAVTASGGGGLSYQWLKNGSVLPGATSATLTLTGAQANDNGNYAVTVESDGVRVTSSAAVLTVGGAAAVGRLINLSVRGVTGNGDQTLIVGFVVSGAGDMPVLLRGWGPALLSPPFAIADALSDPLLRVFRGSLQVAANDDWGSGAGVVTAAASVGASPFGANSKDAALYTRFGPGANTAHLLGAAGTSGVALAELFDATADPADSSPRLANFSVRAQVGTDDKVLIGGFVVGGGGPVTVLVRAVGPALQAFNVNGVLADPRVELYSNGASLQANDNWSASSHAGAIANLDGKAGFALPAGSKDAAILATLAPGAYSAVVRGAGLTTGVALLEVYEIR